LRLYNLIFLNVLRVMAVWFVATAIILIACMLIDWTTNVGWGYPGWSIILPSVEASVGVCMLKLANFFLRLNRAAEENKSN
jgi:hypothetical protein